ncbi:helix-turn-helix transcriptional regulator [Nocardiopsis tropica]|uniref:helix-turn-helix transcriptional regulator n=1 Tax=Nocardiopsis tropica TaxID=109330 RepID=UPI002E8A1A3F|nr:helix-turn-helix transcriptional regulator [Nocardiopsis tropica]
MSGNDLGDLLRAHRARIRPEDAGVPTYGPRRVAGLRREEVAVLAGMSSDYYARLEQGRERNPSAQVLEAVSAVLRLDDDTREHLYRLAGAVPEDARRRDAVETVAPELRQLLDGYPSTPAFVLNPALDILAANALAGALFSPFARADNLARMVFLDPAARSFYARWERAARMTAASLRHAAGLDPHHPGLVSLVAELTGGSADFADLWRSHTVRGKTGEAKEFVHPDVGALSLVYQSFDVRGARGQQLVIYHAEPGSRSAQALALLGTSDATRRAEV